MHEYIQQTTAIAYAFRTEHFLENTFQKCLGKLNPEK